MGSNLILVGSGNGKAPNAGQLVKMDTLLRIPRGLTCLCTACLQIHILHMQNLVKGNLLAKSLLRSQTMSPWFAEPDWDWAEHAALTGAAGGAWAVFS